MAAEKKDDGMAGKWKTHDTTLDKDFTATVEMFDNGEIVCKWPEDYKYPENKNPRPTAYGNLYDVKEGKGYIRFPDYGRVDFTVSGGKITWGNDTTWTKE
mmetsp:Transcript_72884/g.65567  ORF Transcript_72884/g.65567 Transcript_72884/m.65567 type:complete len:100 (-) Transcript_72884:229-528(-)